MIWLARTPTAFRPIDDRRPEADEDDDRGDGDDRDPAAAVEEMAEEQALAEGERIGRW